MIARRSPLDVLLESSQPCLGAVFLSFTFDARFFEEEVLASVLSLRHDPDTELRQFLAEGRRALQQTPVLAIIDEAQFRGGKRLPYHLVRARSKRTFHPKLSLLLYQQHAKLCVGSGNLTAPGHGGNAELGVVLTLDYARDQRTLQELRRFLRQCSPDGEAWSEFEHQLDLLLSEDDPPADDGPPWFLGTAGDEPLLERFFARIPQHERVHAVGVLAPFHQEDGVHPEAAVFDKVLDLVGKRRARGMRLDVGVTWEGNRVTAPPDVPQPDSWQSRGRLWGWSEGRSGKDTVSWFLLDRHEGFGFWCDDGRTPEHRSTRWINTQSASSKAWVVDTIRAYAPAALLKRAGRRAGLSMWLHPEVRRENGRTFRYPLHAKLITVATSEGHRHRTHVLIGSPNATAAALLSKSGNVEAAVHLILDGRQRLPDLCPDLVPCPLDGIEHLSHDYEPTARGPWQWVEDACLDASNDELTVRWRSGAPALRLVYPSTPPRILFEGVPSGKTRHLDFELHPGCAELAVFERGEEGRVPIRVVHMIELPSDADSLQLGLEELIALYAGRFSIEGLRERRRGAACAADGEGEFELLGLPMSPRDVFRAFFGLTKQLDDPDASLGTFRLLLEGRDGVAELAGMLVDAGVSGTLGRAEAWLYGQELARILADIGFADDAVGREKARRLTLFLDGFRERLDESRPRGPWLETLERFYA